MGSSESLSESALAAEQWRVVRSVAAGLMASALIAAAVWWSPFRVPDMSLAERLAFTLRTDLAIIAWLIFVVGRVATLRFYSTADVRGSAYCRPSQRLAVDVAVMQNSFEQAVIAIGVHLVLATVLIGREMILIPVLVALHIVGRIAFRLGYPAGAGARAFGMSMTFHPILLSALLAGALVLVRA